MDKLRLVESRRKKANFRRPFEGGKGEYSNDADRVSRGKNTNEPRQWENKKEAREKFHMKKKKKRRG